MRTCPRCERAFAEVEGAPTQSCPRCGHEMPTGLDLPRADPLAPVDAAGAAAEGLRAYRRSFGALLLIWAPVVAVEATLGVLLVAYQRATGLPLDAGQLWNISDVDRLRFLGVLLPAVVLTYAAQLTAWSFVAARVAGRPASLRGRASTALALGAALAVAYLGGIVFIVPFLVLFHWFLFAPAAVAQDGAGVGASMDASRRFAKRRKTLGFTALVLFVLLGVFLASIVLTATTLVALRAGGVDSPYLDAIVPPLVSWPLAPLVPALPAAYYALAARAPVPAAVAPGAPASERFRTTKCPGCGTLVPYTATGAPVEVACPVCGRAGRVL